MGPHDWSEKEVDEFADAVAGMAPAVHPHLGIPGGGKLAAILAFAQAMAAARKLTDPAAKKAAIKAAVAAFLAAMKA